MAKYTLIEFTDPYTFNCIIIISSNINSFFNSIKILINRDKNHDMSRFQLFKTNDIESPRKENE